MGRKKTLLNEDLRLYTNLELEQVVERITKELDTRKSLKTVLDQSRAIMTKFDLSADEFIAMIKREQAKAGPRQRSEQTIDFLEKNLLEQGQKNDEHSGPEQEDVGDTDAPKGP